MFLAALATILHSQQMPFADPAISRVLVVANVSSPTSLEVAEYYRRRRGLGLNQLVKVDVSTSENVSPSEYEAYVEAPIRKAIAKYGTRVDYVVLTKGIPHKIGDNDPNSIMDGLSLDACLAAMDLAVPPIENMLDEKQTDRAKNPYFGTYEPFDSSRFGMRLVTRLDGYTVADCKALVDHSLTAEGNLGPILIDMDDTKDGPGYEEYQNLMSAANASMKRRGFSVTDDTSRSFLFASSPLIAYIGWGSNDSSFDPRAYRSIRFVPGGITDTAVSTDGRTFLPDPNGQSLIADLIHQGATGAKAYVSEPYASGLSHPDILLDHYVAGFNLAESFYAATPYVKWKDVVIGDPLCRPFGKLP
ncbi:MAG: TIGR03790 family protein, partial [Armatimonadota bacterium]